MASRGRGHKGRPRGTGQAPPTLDQQAFAEVVEIAVAAIAQACAIVSQGGSNDLQCFEAPHPPLDKEREVDDIRGTQDMGVGTKRKEDPSSSNLGKKQKTSVSQGYPGRGRGHQDQGQDVTFNKVGEMMCYFCRQPGHFRRNYPRRQESQGYGTPQSQSSVRRVRVAVRMGRWCATIASSPDI